MATMVPFDLAAAEAMPGWRNSLSWPIAPMDLLPVAHALTGLLGDRAFADRDTAEGRALMLAAPGIFGQALAAVEAAIILARAGAAGMEVAGGPEEVAWLRGEAGSLPVQTFRRTPVSRHGAERLLREVARTGSWTSPLRLPGTLLAPDAFAVNHNALLRQEARHSSTKVVFRDADHLLLAARARSRHTGRLPPDLAVGLANQIVDLVTLPAAVDERLRALLRSKLDFHLQAAYGDVLALADFDLPADDLWAGSAGNVVTRALALEVLQRGGRVYCHDHGGSTGMLASGASIALVEGGACSSFVALSGGVAEMWQTGPLGAALARWRPIEVRAGGGDPHIRSTPMPPPPRPGPRPRVILATGAIVGYRQVSPPVPRDPVYLDWHLRLAATLSRLPIDLRLKPHPEGIFRGRRHPMNDVGRVLTAPFEHCLADADVLLFDFPLSTTFWLALCSNCPIVLLDLGVAQMNEAAAAMIGRRVTTVPVDWVDGRPEVDATVLADAIAAAVDRPADPREWRRFFLD